MKGNKAAVEGNEATGAVSQARSWVPSTAYRCDKMGTYVGQDKNRIALRRVLQKKRNDCEMYWRLQDFTLIG